MPIVFNLCALFHQRRQLVVTGTKGTVELKPLEAQAEGLIYTDSTLGKFVNADERGIAEKRKEYLRARMGRELPAWEASVNGGAMTFNLLASVMFHAM